MNDRPSTAKIALKWGAVAGITTIIYQTILYVTGLNRNPSLSYVTLVFTIGGLYLALTEYKRENGGYMTIGEGVGVGVLAATIMGLLSTAYSVLYMAYIDPTMMQQGLDIARQQMEDQGNMTDDQVDQAMEMSQKFMSPGFIFLAGAIWSALSGAILSLIIAAIIRREPVDPFSLYRMIAIFRKEVGQFFSSPIAYIILGVFLAVLGLLLWVFADTNLLDYGFAELGQFFTLTPWVLLFMAPAVTMRSIADEVRGGTLEWLLTKPVSRWSIVLGKFWANWLLVALALAPTLVYYYSLYQLGNPPGNIDSAAVAGSYLGLLLLAGVFVAVGLWASSLNDNQVVAFVVGAVVGLVLYAGLSTVSSLLGTSDLAYWLNYISLDEQYKALGRGLIDTRNVTYLISLIVLFLAFTERRLQPH